MSESTATLNDLVEALSDGIAFLGQAAERCRDPRYLHLLKSVRRQKEIVVAELKAELALNGGERGRTGAWLRGFRKNYTELRVKLARASGPGYVVTLEEQESRVVSAFREAMERAEPTRVRAVAAAFLPEVQKMQETFAALKYRRVA